MPDWAAIIVALAAFVSAVGSTVASILTVLAKRDIHKIEVATNSMKDALVEATGKAEHAAGMKAGRAEQKAEDKSASQQAGT